MTTLKLKYDCEICVDITVQSASATVSRIVITEKRPIREETTNYEERAHPLGLRRTSAQDAQQAESRCRGLRLA